MKMEYEGIIRKLKKDLHKSIKEFMFKELFNQRKHKEGLVSTHNDLINDIELFFKDWENSDISYLDLKIKTGGFITVSKQIEELKDKELKSSLQTKEDKKE